MTQELTTLLEKHGFSLYPESIRSIGDATQLFVAARDGQKAIGLMQAGKTLELSATILDAKLPSGESVSLHALTWENYQELKAVAPISPSPCDRQASFGTGDRLGLVSAAHLDVLRRYPVFPVPAQQSPRELIKTNRDFQDVLLKAVMGVLESGYTGKFGADADHIKDDEYLMMGARAGYSMYTLDVSDWLQDPTATSADQLSALSRSIVAECAQMKVADMPISEQELLKSALIYEKAMEQIKRSHDLVKGVIRDFDLEVSIDEGSRDTSVEDHLFVAEYLHRSGIDFSSLAPKFPGQFQKGVDYEGNVDALAKSLRAHAAICRQMGGYRLSLHSGSDKFSIYRLFGEATEGNFHIKTSGTSWLQAVKVIASANAPLFRELYGLCLEYLDESKKAYHVSIAREHFPANLPNDLLGFFTQPNVRQLFHISYGVLLDNKRPQICETLNAHEAEHYAFVAEHMEAHLKLLF
ncbi:MAG TPA: tagaturonate epimerase family protein [Armatimonadota bacterium]|nr:tagaturonate epimerase family protein [Armatimonadota bacterium]